MTTDFPDYLRKLSPQERGALFCLPQFMGQYIVACDGLASLRSQCCKHERADGPSPGNESALSRLDAAQRDAVERDRQGLGQCGGAQRTRGREAYEVGDADADVLREGTLEIAHGGILLARAQAGSVHGAVLAAVSYTHLTLPTNREV